MAGKYVTRTECLAAMAKGAGDFVTIKRALTGDDMRGGLVRDVADLNLKVDRLMEQSKCSAEIGLRWRLAIFGAIISALLALLGIAVKLKGG